MSASESDSERCAAIRKSDPCSVIRCSFSRSNCATRTASPISRATASVNAISSSPHRPGVVRWRASTPISSSKITIGTARTAREPRLSSVSRPPSEASSSSGAVSTSSIAKVWRRFTARFETGETPPGLDWLQAGLLPLRRRDVAVRAETDQAAVHRERAAGLLDGDPQQLVDVQLRANASRDPGNEPFPVERLRQAGSRARPIEGKRILARDRCNSPSSSEVNARASRPNRRRRRR